MYTYIHIIFGKCGMRSCFPSIFHVDDVAVNTTTVLKKDAPAHLRNPISIAAQTFSVSALSQNAPTPDLKLSSLGVD